MAEVKTRVPRFLTLGIRFAAVTTCAMCWSIESIQRCCPATFGLIIQNQYDIVLCSVTICPRVNASQETHYRLARYHRVVIGTALQLLHRSNNKTPCYYSASLNHQYAWPSSATTPTTAPGFWWSSASASAAAWREYALASRQKGRSKPRK